jgi:hypothetical protein
MFLVSYCKKILLFSLPDIININANESHYAFLKSIKKYMQNIIVMWLVCT